MMTGFDFDLDGDRLREECGVFGIYGHADAAALTALGLHALQHRGQEAAGIVSFDGNRFQTERRLGLVGDHFTSGKVIDRLQGNSALGHVRYSTTGETIIRNVQPLFAELASGGLAVAHNGNLTNGLTLRKQLIAQGAICQSTSDTEVILHLVAQSKKQRMVERFIDALLAAAPGADRAAVSRGFALMLHAMLAVASQNGRVSTLTGGAVRADDLDAAYAALLDFSTAGMQALMP